MKILAKNSDLIKSIDETKSVLVFLLRDFSQQDFAPSRITTKLYILRLISSPWSNILLKKKYSTKEIK